MMTCIQCEQKESGVPILSVECERCQKPPVLCVCGAIQPQKTKLQVLILQHPQEPDHELGSALLAHVALPNSTLKIGLSWRNLGAVLGQPDAVSGRWAILYLGSGLKEPVVTEKILQFVSQKGNPIDQPSDLEGVVVLDGSWSQVKALWWRNAWLLKLRRVILMPKTRSLYGSLRKEPRADCLSTIEALAEILIALGEKKEVGQHLKGLFSQLLTQYRGRNQQRIGL